tara:strand:+ start:681 stop:1055 length:375 start_codon:yes stop_codon:yes gene_type:complete
VEKNGKIKVKNIYIYINMAIQLTKGAINYIRLLTKQHPNPKEILKFGIKSGGCNGFEYTVNFSTIEKFDHIVEEGNVVIAIDSLSFMYIKNLTIDYENTLLYSGFKFINPNSSGSCGCNKSFSI